MRVDLFDFELPEDRIALRPATPRDSARLLEVDAQSLTDRSVNDLPNLLSPGDVLVVNRTRVIPARFFGHRQPRQHGRSTSETGPRIEVTLHKQGGPRSWTAFARPGKRLLVGDVISFGDELGAEVTSKGERGEVELAFNQSGGALEAAIQSIGEMPLPPYIASKRQVDAQDESDYQTTFATEDGSVAAPTAGLHFTEKLLAALRDKETSVEEVTLHVGAGTFLPVKSEDTEGHKMHGEWGHVSPQVAERLNQRRAEGGRIIAVGTTSLRLLESAANKEGATEPFDGDTDIFITPGHTFRAVDGLLTNFHLPRSTLFMLVCAFSGLQNMKAAYAHAIEGGYWFYSYGDACLLWPEAKT